MYGKRIQLNTKTYTHNYFKPLKEKYQKLLNSETCRLKKLST